MTIMFNKLALGLTLALLVSVVVAIGLGPAAVPPLDTLRYLGAALTGGTISLDEVPVYEIVWQLRTPRVLLAAVVGAGLAAVGVAVQALVRNALADPFVLGISSGASVGAVAVLVSGVVVGVYAVSLGAFLGAVIAAGLVGVVARTASPLRLVLTGIALAYAFQAAMALLVYLVPQGESTATVLHWTLGGFGAATWGSLPVVAALVVAGLVLLRLWAGDLDLLALGDETAVSSGLDVGALRVRLFVLTSLMTGAMVAVSGAIGFVGLIVPHLVRMVAGAVHARVLVLAPLVGAVLAVWVDLVARTVVAPRELPLGVVTALVGVPVFLILLRRRAYVFGSAR
jgi:iron complex transport system permease protein